MATRFCEYDDAEVLDKTGRDGTLRRLRMYYGSLERPNDPHPQAFVVGMAANGVIAAHFHPVDQFQVFLGARGARYLRSPLEEVIVHYTDAHSTYGPISTSEEELLFFTLRPRASEFTGFMPGDRDKLSPGPVRRNIHHGLAESADGVDDSGAARSLFGEQPDGMAAVVLSGQPGEILACPSPVGSAGQYYCVVRGEVTCDGVEHGPMALGWSDSSADAPLIRCTGQEPCEVLVLRFPQKAADAA